MEPPMQPHQDPFNQHQHHQQQQHQQQQQQQQQQHQQHQQQPNSHSSNPNNRYVSYGNNRYHTRTFLVGPIAFEAPDRYTLIRPIGQGSYGLVVSAWDNSTGEKVAIKKITGIMKHEADCKRTLREMLLLKHFAHENVIRLRDVYVPSKDGRRFHDVYTVTDLMDTDLHQILCSNQELSQDHCQFFIYQILRALKYIHGANVLHRDLKPSNILLNGDCDLRVCDFGLARVTSPDPAEQNFLTCEFLLLPFILPFVKMILPFMDMTTTLTGATN